MSVRRLVGADLRATIASSNGTPSRSHRRCDVVAVGVREDRQPPAAARGLARARSGTSGNGGQLGQRARRARSSSPSGRAPEPRSHRARSAPRGRSGTARPGAPARARGSARAARRRRSSPNSARELGADPAVPVDQRAVAVEGRPAVRHGQALVLELLDEHDDALCPPKPNEFDTAARRPASRASFGM